MKRNDTKRSKKLIKRLSTGELTDAERRELDELCADDDALRADVRRTEAILAAARSAAVDTPSDFEWAAFATRLKATIAAEPPRPYARLRLWLEEVRPAFAPRRLAFAASTVAAIAIALGLALLLMRHGPTPSVDQLAAVPEPEWTWEEIEETYALADAELLPGDELLTLEEEFWTDLDTAHDVIEEAPTFNGTEQTDEEYIFG